MSLSRLVRTAPLVVVIALVLASAGAGPARADGCPGSDHYVYDHGTCTDKTGDMLDVIEHAEDESSRQAVDREQRLRRPFAPPAPSVAARPVDTGAMVRAMDALDRFAPSSHVPAIAAAVATRPRAERGRDAVAFRRYVNEYARDAPRLGLSPTRISSAVFLTLVAAYRLLGAPPFSHHEYVDALRLGISMSSARRFGTLSDPEKQRVNDLLVIQTWQNYADDRNARRRHDATRLAALRRDVRSQLRSLGIDVGRIATLDDLTCAVGFNPARSPCDLYRFTLTGGRAGRNPLSEIARSIDARLAAPPLLLFPSRP